MGAASVAVAVAVAVVAVAVAAVAVAVAVAVVAATALYSSSNTGITASLDNFSVTTTGRLPLFCCKYQQQQQQLKSYSTESYPNWPYRVPEAAKPTVLFTWWLFQFCFNNSSC